MKKRYISILAAFFGILIAAGIAVAAFGDRGKILGSSFSVGSADIKLLKDLAQGTSTENLADELTGPSFNNISPNWSYDYPLKIYNNSASNLQLTSNAYYETVNDPDDLRSIIFIEPFIWTDTNNNGAVDAGNGELGSSLGRKTIIKWKTEGFDLGQISAGTVKGIVLKFSTDSISETKQGKTAVFDFLFDSISL